MAKKNQMKKNNGTVKIGMKAFALIASVGAAAYVFRDKIKNLPIYKKKLEEPIEDIQEKLGDIGDSIEDKVEIIQEKIEDKMEDSDAASAVKEKAAAARDCASKYIQSASEKAKDILGHLQEKLSREKTNQEAVSESGDEDFEDAFSDIDTTDREYVSLTITEDTGAAADDASDTEAPDSGEPETEAPSEQR